MTLTFDKKNLIQGEALVAGSQKVSDNTYPQYGITSNYGRVGFFDKDGYLDELVQLKILKASTEVPVKIYFNDKLAGDYLSDEWKIKYGSKKFIAELKDELMNWQDIWFSGIENNEANTYETF